MSPVSWFATTLPAAVTERERRVELRALRCHDHRGRTDTLATSGVTTSQNTLHLPFTIPLGVRQAVEAWRI